MNKIASKISPSATSMIRLEHMHVMTTFHQYRAENDVTDREALVKTACLALEIHAQLEEEIFYPAVRAVAPDTPALAKSVPEHGEMRRLISRLRSMKGDDQDYETAFMELMRDMLHHVADEETIILPLAEKLLADDLGSLGMQMAKPRLELMAPRSGELTGNPVLGMPASSMLMAAGALLAGTYLVSKVGSREHRSS